MSGRKIRGPFWRYKSADNGLVPILVLVVVTVVEIWRTGSAGVELGDAGVLTYLRDVVGSADSSWAIFIGATAAAVTAGVLAIVQGILSPVETVITAGQSAKALSFAVALENMRGVG